MPSLGRRIADALRYASAAAPPPDMPDGPVTDAWYVRAACRNCGAAMRTPFCGACGQEVAGRFVWRDLRRETWDRLRVFEFQMIRTLWQLLLRPGTVARDYVLGRRAAYMHPLKLLVALVAILVLLLAANQYFGHFARGAPDAVMDRMAQRVIAYANWSFSLGIFAIFAAAWMIFPRRLGYNAIELAVLSIYCQSIVLALVIVNLLPTLIWRGSDFVLAHKAASQYYVPAVKMLIVAVAYRQFFLLNLRSDWPRLVAACLAFAGINWLLLRLYAAAILWLVSR